MRLVATPILALDDTTWQMEDEREAPPYWEPALLLSALLWLPVLLFVRWVI